MEDQLTQVNYWNPITILAWILALPVRLLAFIVLTVRARRYDPEKLVCPCCGFRGDSGTNHKTCRVEFRETVSKEQGHLEHTCFRCHAPFYTNTLRPVEEWHGVTLQDRAAKIRQAARKEAL
jgi:hypothetical protein